MTTRPSMLAFTVLAFGVVAALTGCDDKPSDKVTTPAAQASTPASPTSTPSATPTAAPPQAASCENLVNPTTLTEFAGNGSLITPPATFSTKLHDEGNAYASFFDAGGVLCQVAASGAMEASEMYGWAPLVESNAVALQSSLTSEGWTVSAASAGTLYSLNVEADDIVRRCLFTNTEMACALTDTRLAEVLANAPS
ncbi:MAG: hypothetical protein ABJA11_02930 [Pseudolysinimonas sp.]